MRRIKISRGFKQFFGGCIIGGILMGAVALFSVHMVEATSDAEFCGSCHEMQVFCDAWEEGAHGPAHKGIVAAKCTDCHLPHEGTVKYLIAKAKTGTHDVIAHLTKKDTDWIANLEHREKFTYESGCRKCHIELEVPGISLKGFKAHRDYTTGETEETCISCHFDAGHKDLEQRLKDMKKNETTANKEGHDVS